MSDQKHPGERSLSEIAEEHAEAAETMEDDQRLLFENAQRIAELRDGVHQRTAEIESPDE